MRHALAHVSSCDTLLSAMIDTEWFFSKIAASACGSQRQVAKRMVNRQGKEMDVATLNRILKGTHPMLVEQAWQLAEILEIPLEEVCLRAIGQGKKKRR